MKKVLLIALLLQTSVLLAEIGDRDQQTYACNLVDSKSVNFVVKKGIDFSFPEGMVSEKRNQALLKNKSQIAKSELIAQTDSIVHQSKSEELASAIAYLIVDMNDGLNISHELKQITKVYFLNGQMHLSFLDPNEVETIEIGSIRKLLFSDSEYPIDTSQVDSTSVLRAEELLVLNVFPNPFKHTLNIANNGNEEVLTVEVFDLAGGLVIEKDALISNGDYHSIDLNYLQSGSYILKINLTNKVLTRKIIKK